MKDETFRAKEKHVQRMTRDGLIEENAVTGEQVNAGTRPREERFGSKKADAEPKISRSKRYFKEQEAPKGASSASERKSPLRDKKTYQRRLRMEQEQQKHTGKLRFEPEGGLKMAGKEIGRSVHRKIERDADGNAAIEAASRTEQKARHGLALMGHRASRFVEKRHYKKAMRLQKKTARMQADAVFQRTMAKNPNTSAFRKLLQKRSIRKRYQKAAIQAQRAKQAAQKSAGALSFLWRHKGLFVIFLIIGLLIGFLFTLASSLGGVGGQAGGSIMATTYPAADMELCDADLEYTRLETELEQRISRVESDYPGYDEYRYQIDEIGHNPHELAAYLSAKYGEFTFEQVQPVLQTLFERQYLFTTQAVTETRTEEETDPETGEVTSTTTYEVECLNVQLTNRGLASACYDLTAEEKEYYTGFMESKGNRQNLLNPFEDGAGYSLSSMYGYRVHPIDGTVKIHRGLDLAASEGTKILAIHDGTVKSAGENGGYGLCVEIEQGDGGYTSKYAHCSRLLVSEGQAVKQGDVIAEVGSTGDSTGPHLHLELMQEGEYLNPFYFVMGLSAPSYAAPTPGNPGYEIPPEALSDARFAALIHEAEKYLGYPYVWGGSTPETSFDCSGFVCWSINQSGVGSVGRTTAQGLYNLCTPVSAVDAKPGDLLFFTGTYDSPGPVSHVAIYVGDNMMIHAGKPIQYASFDTPYWRQHFYSFGRLP